jgi:protein involved in polysaccharide export with SLBB domain
LIVVAATTTLAGCHLLAVRHHPAPPGAASIGPVARELDLVSLPTYRIAPPDSLEIRALRVVPRPPYKVQPLDILQIVATGTSDAEPIAGFFPVEPDGNVNLGASYGFVRVVDLSLDEAREAVRQQLIRTLRPENVNVVVNLAQSLGVQQIDGEHMVGQDGMINLGIYGKIYVTGMSARDAKLAIEKHLSDYLVSPQVSVRVLSYQSQYYYVVLEGAGLGDQVLRFPVTGGETVLDALANVQGLTQLQSTNIWLARPTPDIAGCDQILPVRWSEITRDGNTATNWQVFPGDRIFVAEDKALALRTWVDKVISPFERMIAFALLGSQSIQSLNRLPQGVSSAALL